MTGQKKAIIIGGIILLFLVACLCVLLIFSPDNSEQNSSKTNTEEYKITTATNGSDIQSIKVTNKTGSYLLTRTESGIEVEGMDGSLIDKARLSTLFDTMASTKTQSTAEEGIKDQSAYGFDDPSATVVISQKTGGDVTIKVGTASPFVDAYYCQIEGIDKAFLISNTFINNFLQPRESFRDLNFFEPITDDTQKSLKRIKISGEGIQDIEVIQQSYISTTQTGTYKLSAPVSFPADAQAVKDNIITWVQSVAGDAVAADNVTDLSKYGLDHPKYVLEMDYMGDTIRVLVGDKSADGRYYAMREGSKTVLYIKEYRLELFKANYITLIGSSLYTQAADSLSNLTLQCEGNTYSFDLNNEGTSLTAKYDGKTISNADFTQFYSQLLSIEPQGGITSYSGGTPSLTIIATSLDGASNQKIEFVPIDNSKSAVVINGKAYFYVYSRKADTIISELKTMVSKAA